MLGKKKWLSKRLLLSVNEKDTNPSILGNRPTIVHWNSVCGLRHVHCCILKTPWQRQQWTAFRNKKLSITLKILTGNAIIPRKRVFELSKKNTSERIDHKDECIFWILCLGSSNTAKSVSVRFVFYIDCMCFWSCQVIWIRAALIGFDRNTRRRRPHIVGAYLDGP